MRRMAFFGNRVDLIAKGNQTEPFLNRLYRAGFHVGSPTRQEDGTLRFWMPAREFKRIRVHAFRTGTKVKIRKKRGFYWLIRPFRRRIGLAVGLVLFMGAVYYASGFIWQVEVIGCETTSYTEVLADLEALGLYVGCPRDLDVAPIENRYLTDNEKLTWMSINIRGTTAFVEVKEKSLTPEIIDLTTPTNVVASRDGIIKEIRDYGGSRCAEIGMAVRAGDLLVSGDWTDQYEVRRLSRSVATVIAETRREREITVPLKEKYRRKTGKNAKKYTISLGKLKIPLYFSKKISYNDYDIVEKSHPLSIGRFVFPLRLSLLQAEEVEQVSETRTVEQAREAAMAELAFYQADRLADVTVLRREVEETVAEDALILRVEYYCEEEIGVEVPIPP